MNAYKNKWHLKRSPHTEPPHFPSMSRHFPSFPVVIGVGGPMKLLLHNCIYILIFNFVPWNSGPFQHHTQLTWQSIQKSHYLFPILKQFAVCNKVLLTLMLIFFTDHIESNIKEDVSAFNISNLPIPSYFRAKNFGPDSENFYLCIPNVLTP